MILDSLLEFADATSVGTPNNTTVNVGDIIDLTNVRDIGNGEPMYVVIQIETLITSGGSAQVAFQLVSDSTTTIATDDGQSQHGRTESIPVATLVAGYELTIVIPPEMSNAFERYLAFQVVETAGQALTAGAVNAFITQHPSSSKSYPDGTN